MNLEMQLQIAAAASSHPAVITEDYIASVLGEFYAYHATFTPGRPLGYLMKCKASKDRSCAYADEHPDVDLVFLFLSAGISVCSPDSPLADATLGGSIDLELRRSTQIVRANISEEEFDTIRTMRSPRRLSLVCTAEVTHSDPFAGPLEVGMILAIIAGIGKVALMRVEEIRPQSIKFAACHVQL